MTYCTLYVVYYFISCPAVMGSIYWMVCSAVYSSSCSQNEQLVCMPITIASSLGRLWTSIWYCSTTLQKVRWTSCKFDITLLHVVYCEDITRETPANVHYILPAGVITICTCTLYMCKVIYKLFPQVYIKGAVMIIPKIWCWVDWSSHNFKIIIGC